MNSILRLVITILLIVGCQCEWEVVINNTTGGFSVAVEGIEWLGSTNPAFGSATEEGWRDDWVITQRNVSLKSNKLMGSITEHCFTWNNTIVTCYEVSSKAIIATVHYPQNGWNAKPDNSYSVLSAFPSVNFTRPVGIELGYTQWWHTFIFRQTIEIWGNSAKQPTTGPDAGPIAVWDKVMNNTIIISPLTNVMSSNTKLSGQALRYGLMGTIPKLPGGFTHSTLLYYNPTGLRKAMFSYGSFFRQFHNNPINPLTYNNDVTLSQLGYSTDHGAAYYYRTLQNKTYEDTIIEISKYYKSLNIPVKYALLDSWWYQQGHYDGTVTWKPKPGIFPHGMGYVSEKTGWKFQLHNKYWSANTTYATQNNGSYRFTIEGSLSVPNDQQFWNDLFKNATKNWNMIVYEQDWLYSEWMGLINTMLASPTRAEQWLSNINNAAAVTNTTIQLCMSWPRFVLYAAANMPQVTQVRASDDYTGDNQWFIGVSSLFVSALGFRPSKDGVRTTVSQPDRQEPLAELQSAVATISGGPVALVDNINYTNPDIVRRIITKSGKLLSPDIPGVSIDEQHIESAFMNSTGSFTNGAVIHSSCSLFSKYEWYFLVASGFFYSYKLNIGRSCSFSVSESQLWDVYNTLDSTLVASNVVEFTIPVCPHAVHLRCNHTRSPVYQIAPKFSSGWSIIGESQKWVSLSHARFTSVLPTDVGIECSLTGIEGEELVILFVDPMGTLVNKTVVFNATGKAEVSVP